MNGTDVDVDNLDAAEGPLDGCQAFVGPHDLSQGHAFNAHRVWCQKGIVEKRKEFRQLQNVPATSRRAWKGVKSTI